MVHVDVKRRPERDGYTIEVSVDGAKWLEHWFLPSRGTYEVDRDLTAKADARMYAAGIKFGGSDVRLTAFGEEVYIPDMSTVRASTVRAST